MIRDRIVAFKVKVKVKVPPATAADSNCLATIRGASLKTSMEEQVIAAWFNSAGRG